MTAIELRIGNWVYNSTTKENMQVYPMMIPQLHRIENENGSLEDCNIKPIPLTEDILLKCGFETSQWDCHSTFRKNICSDGCIVISLEHKHVEIGDLTLDIEIKYLHQLQNMFYCLCGKELEINL